MNRSIPDMPARWTLVLAGLMMALPFLQSRHFYPLPLFYSEWLAVVLGLAALFLFLLPRYSQAVEVPWIALTPVALCGVLLLHLVLLKAAYPQQILLGLLYLIWATVLILLGAALRREFGLAVLGEVLAWFILGGGVLNALAGLLQHYEWRGILEPFIASKITAAVYGNLVQPNHFASHIATALASLLFLHARGRMHGVVAALPAFLLLFVLSLAGSRSAWLYLGVILVLTAWLRCLRQGVDSQRLLFFALLLLPGFVFTQWLVQQPLFSAPTLQVTAAERLFGNISGASARLQLWHEAWQMFLQSPLMGVGYGQFAWQHFLSAGSAGNPANVGHVHNAHNILMQFLAETGLIGVLALACGVAAWLWSMRRIEFDVVHWWLLAALAILGVHSMLEYPLWHAYFLGPAAVLLGAAAPRNICVLRTKLVVRAGFAGVIFVGTLSTLGLIHDYYRLEVALFPRPAGTARSEIDRAHRDLMNVHGSLLTPYVELAFARVIDLDRRDIDKKLAFSERVMRFAPTQVIAYRHAALLALKGEQAQAERQLDMAAKVYPAGLTWFAGEIAGVSGRDGEMLSRLKERTARYLGRQTSAVSGG